MMRNITDKEKIKALETRLSKWESINHSTFNHNPIDAIAKLNGWMPLEEGQEMIVHYCGKEYVIKRNPIET